MTYHKTSIMIQIIVIETIIKSENLHAHTKKGQRKIKGAAADAAAAAAAAAAACA